MTESVSSPIAQIAQALRRERTRAGLTMAEVARRAGIAKSTLSQLEAGNGNPSIETLWALGVALGVPFSSLVESPPQRTRVVRAGEGPAVAAAHSPYIATLLAACPPNARRDIYAISAEPGEARESEPHMPGVTEHVILGSGRALVGPISDPVELHPGDYISYAGDAPHVFRALEPGTTATLISEHV